MYAGGKVKSMVKPQRVAGSANAPTTLGKGPSHGLAVASHCESPAGASGWSRPRSCPEGWNQRERSPAARTEIGTRQPSEHLPAAKSGLKLRGFGFAVGVADA